MDFLQLAKKRYSARDFSDRLVEPADLQQILEAGRVAPTATNAQPQRVIVMKQKDQLEQLSQAANTYHAPLALLVCADHDQTWKRGYDKKDMADIDATIVTTHMMLQAASLGLDSLWICYFDPSRVRKICNLPQNVEPINLLIIGYNKADPKNCDRHDHDRKPLSETVREERFD